MIQQKSNRGTRCDGKVGGGVLIGVASSFLRFYTRVCLLKLERDLYYQKPKLLGGAHKMSSRVKDWSTLINKLEEKLLETALSVKNNIKFIFIPDFQTFMHLSEARS